LSLLGDFPGFPEIARPGFPHLQLKYSAEWMGAAVRFGIGRIQTSEKLISKNYSLQALLLPE
jgi:hypothetical protein